MHTNTNTYIYKNATKNVIHKSRLNGAKRKIKKKIFKPNKVLIIICIYESKANPNGFPVFDTFCPFIVFIVNHITPL